MTMIFPGKKSPYQWKGGAGCINTLKTMRLSA